MSESDISVPILISAATFKVASKSSGRMAANEVEAALVRKPKDGGIRARVKLLQGTTDPFLEQLLHMQDCL